MPVLKELCHRLALENSVSFLGFQKKPLKMLQDAKCMLMTSRWEGLPMSALEAMALGVPLVCTPTDGLNALITEGETGFCAAMNRSWLPAFLHFLTLRRSSCGCLMHANGRLL